MHEEFKIAHDLKFTRHIKLNTHGMKLIRWVTKLNISSIKLIPQTM